MTFPLHRRVCNLPYHNVTAWYTTFSESAGQHCIYQEKDRRTGCRASASVCLRRLIYGDDGERPAFPWQFADRHGLPPPQSPAERRSQLLRLCLTLHRLAQDSDTPRNSVDQAVESRQIALLHSQSLWLRYTALPAQNGVRYRQVRAR